MRLTFGIVVFSACLTPTAALSQNLCGDVLRYAARNYTVEAQQNAVAKSLYDQACSGSQSRSSSSLSLGLDAIIEAIPVSFNLGTGSNEEKLQRFCSMVSEQFSSDEQRFEAASLVSVDAVQAWESCVRMYKEGVKFQAIVNTTQAAITVEKISADPVDIGGVQYDKELLTCTVPAQEGGGEEEASLNTRARLVSAAIWRVACERIPGDGPNGERVYPNANLTVYTGRGAFSLPIPADATLGRQTASELNQQISSIQQQVNAVAARHIALDCRRSSSESAWSSSPTVEAVSQDALNAGYVLVAGGCELGGPEPGSPGARAHNGPITASRSNDAGNGWYCRAMDPPNIPMEYSVRAWAVYCKPHLVR